jgi:hypothetical protein
MALMAQCKGMGFHALTGQLTGAEIEGMVRQVVAQVEGWLGKDSKEVKRRSEK